MSPDQDGFDAFASAYYARLVRAARLIGRDPTQAEDLVQTALIRTLRHWHSLRDESSACAYVHTTMVRLAQRSTRRRWWGERPTAEVPERAAVDEFAGRDVSDAVRGALARLSLDQRVVLVLRFYLDLSEAETAARLNCALGTVKSRTSRAIAALRADGVLMGTMKESVDD